MTPRWVLIAALAAVSVATHLKGLSAPLLDYHYHRQCNTAAIARNYHENGMKFLHPEIDWEGPYRGLAATEFPLYMWLMGLLWPLGGLGDMWGRILSAVFSAWTAIVLFKFLERKVGREAAFYAGILFSFIPLEIYFGRTVQPEAIALLGAMAALYHWDKSLDGARPWRDWTLALVWAFLSISHKLPYIHILVPLAALSLLRLGRPALGDFKTLTAAPIVLSAVYAWYRYAGTGTYVVPAHRGEFLIMLEYARLPYFVFFQFLSRYPELAATYGGLVLIAFGARELYKKGDRFFGAWFAAAALMLVAGGGYTFRHEYTSLPLVPLNAALMGVGLASLRRKASVWALLLLVLSIPVHAALRIKHWYNITHPFLPVDAARATDEVSRRDDLFLCNERGSSVFLYHLHRKGWSWNIVEQGPERLGMIEERIRQGAKFYATAKTPEFTDPSSVYARFFASYPVVYDRGGLLIYRLSTNQLPAHQLE